MNVIIQVADSLLKNLEENESVLTEKRLIHSKLVDSQESLRHSLYNMRKVILSKKFTNEEKEEALYDMTSSMIANINNLIKASNDELIRLESMQEGMKRALHTVKEIGENIPNEKKEEQ